MAITSYQTKKGTRWLVQIYRGGKRTAVKGGFPSKSEAKRWERDTEAQLDVKPLIPVGMVFRDLANKYLDHVKDMQRPNTYSTKRTAAKRFTGFIGPHTEVASITREQAMHFIAGIKSSISPGQANEHLKNMRALFNWGIRHDLISHNPFGLLRRYPVKRPEKYIPPFEDWAAVLLAADSMERAYLECMFHTGGRQIEVLERLTWEDVNFERQTLRLWTMKRRGGNMEARTISMSKTLFSVLQSLYKQRDKSSAHVFTNPLTGGQYHRNSRWVKTLYHRLCAKAGVKLFTAHCVRHFVASHLQDAKKDTRAVQRLLGHQHIATTERYLHDLDVDRSLDDALDGFAEKILGDDHNEITMGAESPTKKGSQHGL